MHRPDEDFRCSIIRLNGAVSTKGKISGNMTTMVLVAGDSIHRSTGASMGHARGMHPSHRGMTRGMHPTSTFMVHGIMVTPTDDRGMALLSPLAYVEEGLGISGKTCAWMAYGFVAYPAECAHGIGIWFCGLAPIAYPHVSEKQSNLVCSQSEFEFNLDLLS